MDSFLVALVIMALAALSNWLQRRAQANQEPPPPPDPDRPPLRPLHRKPSQVPNPLPPPTVETTLERELRRLLGGEPEREAPRPPFGPRPVASSRPPATTLPRSEQPLPPPLPPMGSPIPPPVVGHGTRLTESASAYARAQALHGAVTQHMRSTEERIEAPPRILASRRAGPVRPAFSAVARWRRSPAAAREAFIASLIFSRPKGMEMDDGNGLGGGR